jgi:hypothetical protein
MDAEARNQYLRELREEYVLAAKATKSRLLDEAVKRTGLARKVIIRKLARPVTLVRRPRAKRRRIYDAAVAAALIELWTLFDYPCGQRLVPLLREQVPRLRQQGWWQCPEEVAAKLLRISAKTADRLLAPQRRQLRLDRRRGSSMRRLLLEQIPLKVAEEWDRRQVGNLQVDFVAHCGQSTAGSFLWTLSTVDIASNWWEGEPVMDRTQQSTRCALDAIRRRLPFRLREIHPDNDSSMINHLLVEYCRREPDCPVALAPAEEERQLLGGAEELDARAQAGGLPPAERRAAVPSAEGSVPGLESVAQLFPAGDAAGGEDPEGEPSASPL